MKRILITGDSGLLGANLAYLYRDSYEVIGISRGDLHISNTEHFSLDMTNSAELSLLVHHTNPDAIIHTAAMTSVDGCEEHPELARKINTHATEILAQSAKALDIPIVYISTDAFYEGLPGEQCSETHPLTPNSVYAHTKLLGESPVLQYHKGTVLRTNIYGFNLQQKHSFGEWVLHGLLENRVLTMFSDLFFSPILVNDLAEMILNILHIHLAGLYNLGGSGAVTKYEFAERLKTVFQLQTGRLQASSVKDFPFVAWRSSNMAMQSDKICNALQVRLPSPFQSIENFYELAQQGYPEKLKEAAL